MSCHLSLKRISEQKRFSLQSAMYCLWRFAPYCAMTARASQGKTLRAVLATAQHYLLLAFCVDLGTLVDWTLRG